MRRSMGRRGNNHSGGGGNGPLITEHLQDIDLELELLKRKREMIEQQQQLLVMEQQFKTSRHSYDQTRYDEPGSNRDYSHMYGSGPKHGNQFGRKRQAEIPWQYDSGPKRTPPKKKSSFNQNGSGSGNGRTSRPQQGQGQKSGGKPAPLMGIKVKPSIGQRITKQKAPQNAPKKDFAPSKVSKQKAPPAPNKMASLSAAERKSLVAAATSDGDMSRMLLPDRTPSQQVSGRLELALGAIMKNIKGLIDSKPENATMLRTLQLQRVMKQAVRERIRTVMLGKVVGSLIEILAIYREEFPEETDADILNIALEAGGLPPSDQTAKPKFIESGEPSDFFRNNMVKLMENTLTEMFTKLEDIYTNAPPIEAGSEPPIDLQKNPEAKEDQNDYKEFLGTTIKVFEVKRILPRLMKKYVPYVIKLLNVDAMYQNTQAAITMKTNEKAARIASKRPQEGQDDDKTTVSELKAENRYNLPYYVKIMGKPNLPKKKAMQTFLNQYNPKSIKKHRAIHNLLFVGFNEKADFDVMVAADGTVVGKSTLSIRVCNKAGPKESNEENGESNDINQESINQEPQKEGEGIPSELDGQITDLLSAIRKSEEEDAAQKENGEQTKNKDEEENSENVIEQADAIKMDEGVGDSKNDEEMDENAENEESNENATNIDENNGDNDNTASQYEDATDEVETQNAETEAENPEVPNDKEKSDTIDINDDSKDGNSQEGDIQMDDKTGEQADDKMEELKSGTTGRSTPSRMSTRLATVTPSTIRTRRASRLAPQN